MTDPRWRQGSRVLYQALVGAALVSATFAAGCNPLFGIHEGKPRPSCADPDVIDDMEDGDSAICEVNGRHGYWYTVPDGTSRDLTPGADFQPTLIDGGERGTSLYAARFTGSGFTGWGALMGFDFNVQGEGKKPYDASNRGGISFWMKSNVAVSVDFLTPPTVQQAFSGTCVRTDPNCDNPFSFKITAPSGGWAEYNVPFSALRQLNGSVVWNPSQLLGIHFRVTPGAPFDVWVDDLRFWDCAATGCLPTCDDPDRNKPCAMIRDFPAACRPMEVDCSTGVGTCGDPLMIDNMEDEEPDICATNGRIGTWFAGGDGTGTDLIPAPGRFFAPTLIPGGRGASHFAARRSGTGFTKWGASMGLQFNDADVGLQPYDASGFSGIKFWMKSTSTVYVEFPIIETIQAAYDGICQDDPTQDSPTSINCDNPFTYAVPASSDWVEYEVPFGALRQEAFFDAQGNLRTSSATFTPSHLVDIIFRTGTTGDVDLWIDDLRFYSCANGGCTPTCADLSAPVGCLAVGGFGSTCRALGADCTTAPKKYVHTGVWGSGPNDAWIAGYSLNTFTADILHWNGSTWSRTFPGAPPAAPPLWGLGGSGASDVWAVGDRGTILRWNGSTWAVTPSATTSRLSGLWTDSASDVWAVQYPSTMIHWDGAAWSTVVSGAWSLWSVWGSGPSDIWAVGSAANIVHSDGATGTVSTSGTNSLFSVWGSGPTDVWAVGDEGTILRGDGSTWTALPSGTSAILLGVWGSGPADVWVVGASGTILHWDGVAWTAFASGTSNYLYSVWGSSPDDVWAVGAYNTILHWNGSTWERR